MTPERNEQTMSDDGGWKVDRSNPEWIGIYWESPEGVRYELWEIEDKRPAYPWMVEGPWGSLADLIDDHRGKS